VPCVAKRLAASVLAIQATAVMGLLGRADVDEARPAGQGQARRRGVRRCLSSAWRVGS